MNDLNPLQWTPAQQLALGIAILIGMLVGVIFPIPTEGALQAESAYSESSSGQSEFQLFDK
jgi:hypothetical protein